MTGQVDERVGIAVPEVELFHEHLADLAMLSEPTALDKGADLVQALACLALDILQSSLACLVQATHHLLPKALKLPSPDFLMLVWGSP